VKEGKKWKILIHLPQYAWEWYLTQALGRGHKDCELSPVESERKGSHEAYFSNVKALNHRTAVRPTDGGGGGGCWGKVAHSSKKQAALRSRLGGANKWLGL